jgi:hypothetical protein
VEQPEEPQAEASPRPLPETSTVPAVSKSNAISYLAIGTGLLLAGALGLSYFIRKNKVEETSSLISRSLDTRK